MLPTIQVLVEYVMCVSQGAIPIYGGDTAYQWGFVWRLRLPHYQINKEKLQITCIEYYLKIH